MENWKKYYLRFVGIATLNVAAFVVYRYTYDALTKKAKNLENFELNNYENYIEVANFYIPSISLHKNKFNLILKEENNNIIDIFGVNFKNINFIFKKEKNKLHWNLLVDFNKCINMQYNLTDLLQELLNKKEFKDFKILWELKK